MNIFIERRGRIQERDRLLNDAWGYESLLNPLTVDTHIRRLRIKLGNAADMIESVRGYGYRFL